MTTKITPSRIVKSNASLVLKNLKYILLNSNSKILLLVLVILLSSQQIFSQTNQTHNGKESIRQANGITAKSKNKTSFEDFSALDAFYLNNRSNICSPETSLIITEGTSYGISRSTINNNGVPSFCLSLGDDAPQKDDIYNTTLTPASDISFNNPNLSKATILERVQRTMSILEHPNFAPSSLPNSLEDDFYKAISVVVWSWTNNLTISNSINYSWTGSNGNTYNANNLKNWVINSTLQKSDVFWLLPVNNDLQPEVLINQNSSSNCCPTPPVITTSTVAPTSGNNGKIKISSATGAQFYGISSLNAGSYNGATTIATATKIPNSLPTTILNNAPSNGGTYIVRVFTNIDGCFTDYTITTPSNSGQGCTNIYAEFQSDTNNVVNKFNAEGAPDGNFAKIYNSNQQLILDFNQTFPAGTEYKITWRKRNGQSGIAYIDLSESTSSNSGFINHPNKPQTSTSNNFITTTVTANSNFRYLAFDKGNINNTDYDLDAVEVICVNCDVADNKTSNASITESQTKILTGSPASGTWSVVSGGGSINGNIYTPADINTNTTVKIRYTIAADGSCAATTDDVTFTVTPVCVTADNTTSSASISEGQTKTLTGSPAGGTWSIVSGGGTINGNIYTPDNIADNVNVKIKYTIAADGDCTATSDEVTFKVEAFPVATVSKTDVTCYGLDDGTITFTFPDISSRTHIAFSLNGGSTYQTNVADNSGSVTYSNITPGTYDVWVRWGDQDYPMDLGADVIISEPAEIIADNTTSTATINEGETKTLTGNPSGGTWSIVSGGGTINGNIYTPSNINTNTTVKIRYTLPANGTCAASTDDVIFTVTPVCLNASNSTSTASINEGQTKTLVGSPAGGTWSIVNGNGVISNNNTYTPNNINSNDSVELKYTIPADGSCAASSSFVSFTVTPICVT
ncbi:hypothetical protein BTO18_01245, partial [Polaribacter porphyrae]